MYRKFIFTVFFSFINTHTCSAEGLYNLVGAGISPLIQDASRSLGFAVSVGGGYNFTKYVGVEAQVAVIGIGTANDVAVLPIPSIALNGYILIQENVSIFGKVGRASTIVNYTGDSTEAHYSGQSKFYGLGVEVTLVPGKNTYRFGVDYYDLGATPGSPLSAYYLNISSTTHF